MREFGWDKFWDCLRLCLLKRWGNSAQTSFEIVWQYLRWSNEEIRLRCVRNCLTMFSLKRWGNLAETSIEIVLEYICWSDEDIRLKQVLKLSDNIFVEVMKKSAEDVFWTSLTVFPLERWGNAAETSLKIVWQYFRWSDEEIRLRRVLNFS